MPITHVVEYGECLSSIAARYGIADWRRIYDAPENAELRNKRKDPNIIVAGDEVVIPDIRLKATPGSTEQRHRFSVKSEKTFLRLHVFKDLGRENQSARYKLTLEGCDEPLTGSIGDDGKLDVEIPPRVTSGILTLYASDATVIEEFCLDLGALDPIDTVSGIQQRLRRLHFGCGPVDGLMGPRTEAALRFFQKRFGITEEEPAGTQTRAKLAQLVFA